MPISSGILEAMRGALMGSLLTVRVATSPSPSHRPQVGKFGTYYAKGYQVCSADCVKQLAVQRPVAPLAGELGAVIEVVVERPKKTKLAAPRGDVDNYAKAIMDSATKTGIWIDDVQVQALAVLKRWAEPGETPGYTMTVGAIS